MEFYVVYYTDQSSFEVEMAAVHSFEVKTEADSNDITEHPRDDKPRPYVYMTYNICILVITVHQCVTDKCCQSPLNNH